MREVVHSYLMAMTIEIPEVLRAKVDAYVERRRADYSRYSVKDAIIEALRNLVDGPQDATIAHARAVITSGPTSNGGAFQTGAPKMTAAQLAASIPGLTLGESLSVTDSPVFANGDGEDVKTKPWLPELTRIQRMSEMDPSSSADEFASLLRGEQFHPPKGWGMWSLEKRARWLDQNKPIIVEEGWS
jgi:hypothetical protein